MAFIRIFILPMGLFFVSSMALARMPFGFMTKMGRQGPPQPRLTFHFSGNWGIYPGGTQDFTLYNDGTAMSGLITINVTGAGFSLYYLGIGDNCTGTFLLPATSCSFEVQNSGGGTGTLRGTDSTYYSELINIYNCPGC